jgi:hypothetical protein
MRLFALLTEADQLIGQMRAVPAIPVSPVSTALSAGATAPASPAPAAEGPRVRTTSVPQVLLGLGALCVLVAASLFLPFAWELLGVTGRTVVLLLLTAVGFAAAGAAARRGLRATAESLGLVTHGLLAFDMLGARASGWLGDMTGASFSVLIGSLLVVSGTALTLQVRRSPVGSLVSAEAVAVLGGLVLGLGLVGLDALTADLRLALAVLVGALIAVGSARLRVERPGLDSMEVATVGHGLVTVLFWVGLLLTGLAALSDAPADGLTWGWLWPGGAGVTLLLAGAYAGGPALVRGWPAAVRAVCLAVALVPWTVALTAPAYDEGANWLTLAALLVVVASLPVLALVRRPWNATVLPALLLGAMAATALVAPLAVTAFSAAMDAVIPMWGGTADGRFDPDVASELGSPWLLPLVVATVAVSVVVAAREAARNEGADGGALTLSLLGGVLTLWAVCGALVLEAAPVWSVLGVLVVATTGAAVAALLTGRGVWHLAEAALAVAALVVSGHDETLSLATCLVLLALAVAHHVRDSLAVRAVGGLLVAPLIGGVVWSGGALLDAEPVMGALVALLMVSALVIVRGLVDEPAGVTDAASSPVLGMEAGSAVTATLAILAGTAAAPDSERSVWLAVLLTVAGAAATVVALTRDDRRDVGWLGGLLLAAASWVRLADIGVEEPEAYTLPSAVALLVVGWWRTRYDRDATTLGAWSPGLGLALVPSLLWSLAEPLSLRALLLGLACLALAVAGAQLRLAAPFVWGAGVGAVLVLWEVVPPALEMSAWLVIGAAGAGLLVLGASWERRLREAQAALGYVRALR